MNVIPIFKSLSTDPKSLDPVISTADAIIAYSPGGFPNLHSEKLLGEMMFPVCAPELAAEIKTLDDLRHHVILRDTQNTDEHMSNWDFWATEQDTKLPPMPKQQHYGQANMVIQAAINGTGVAMGRCPLVIDAIEKGELVTPFPQKVQSQFSYWFVCSHLNINLKSIQAFRTWLHEQATTLRHIQQQF